ncbi:MAG: energy transducer TonB [Gammaproteobacteria bacterium]|nr:energy transducer TonB [Gammaproteobacteria bacterium]
MAKSINKTEPAITAADRMSFSLFLAAAFHALILLGISFTLPDKTIEEFQRTLDVVLATKFSEERPEEADFIGQADQLGGGDEEEAHRPSTTEITPFPDEQMKDVAQPEQLQVSTPVVEQEQVLASDLSEKIQEQPDTQPLEEQDTVDSLSAESIYSRSLEIASLTAQLEASKKNLSKRPRKRQVSAAIHRSSDALYLDKWRRKIESIGNLNYPEKAKREGIYGSLSLKVAIKNDGTIHEIVILRGSGHKILDDSAIRIVRLAAPFAPLTKEMTIDTEILEIVRVWQFEPDNSMKTK